VVNKSVRAAGTQDPLLAARLDGEREQMERMAAGLARRSFIVPWLTRPPIGVAELSGMVSHLPADSAAIVGDDELAAR